MASELKTFVSQPGVVLLDVRSADEYKEGHVEGSINVPHDTLEERSSDLPADKATPICCFCAHGRRGGIAEGFLKEHGYTNVLNGISFSKVGDAVGK